MKIKFLILLAGVILNSSLCAGDTNAPASPASLACSLQVLPYTNLDTNRARLGRHASDSVLANPANSRLAKHLVPTTRTTRGGCLSTQAVAPIARPSSPVAVAGAGARVPTPRSVPGSGYHDPLATALVIPDEYFSTPASQAPFMGQTGSGLAGLFAAPQYTRPSSPAYDSPATVMKHDKATQTDEPVDRVGLHISNFSDASHTNYDVHVPAASPAVSSSGSTDQPNNLRHQTRILGAGVGVGLVVGAALNSESSRNIFTALLDRIKNWRNPK